MDDFIVERASLIRQLADRADPFTKIRLLKLAQCHDDRLRPPSKVVRQPTGLPTVSIGSTEHKVFSVCFATWRRRGRCWWGAILLTNQNGALLTVSGRQVGLIVAADLNGLVITVR